VVGDDPAGARLSAAPEEWPDRDDDERRDRAETTGGPLPDAAVPISDAAHVRALLIAAARQGTALSYAELLNALGHPFTRPRMRALCRTLDAIDEAARAAGEPDLAVLVVRQSDGLPGQGWWVGTRVRNTGYAGAWTGPEASRLVRDLQLAAFAFWRSRP
jgi:hypothetical protein